MVQRPIESFGEFKVLQRCREHGSAVAKMAFKGQGAKVGRQHQAVQLVAVCELLQVKRKREILDFRYAFRWTKILACARPVQYLNRVPNITVLIVRDARVQSALWNSEELSLRIGADGCFKSFNHVGCLLHCDGFPFEVQSQRLVKAA